MSKWKIRIGLGLLTLSGALNVAVAAWPEQPIRMIVSFPPGSGTDSNARFAAREMSERLGVPVMVENKPGGNSFIGFARKTPSFRAGM